MEFDLLITSYYSLKFISFYEAILGKECDLLKDIEFDYYSAASTTCDIMLLPFDMSAFEQ